MRVIIRNGQVLAGDALLDGDVAVSDDGNGVILSIGASDHRQADRGGVSLDATGLLVLPGMVDLHGDAFERQIEPRPGVLFDVEPALLETDRQLIANGITTAFHGVTWSWEPGLRGGAMTENIVRTIETLRPRLASDTFVQLRHETFNLDAEAAIGSWLRMKRIGCLAFNDHMRGTIKDRERPGKLARMVERSGLSQDAFNALVERTWARRDEVPASIERLAAIAVTAGIPLLSHDDDSAATRAWFRDRGCAIAEFPTTVSAAEAAAAAGEVTVFGAPNVMRGGSHTGCPSATDMIARDLCSVLVSDYYYPALLAAPFTLAQTRVSPFDQAWALVSANPARALGLEDRGIIAAGKRADLILVDASDSLGPHVVATIARGRIRHLTEAGRLSTS
jgi:alpha-D-ribose 1-methylphosphonate 5-triphosphate diphosphatase